MSQFRILTEKRDWLPFAERMVAERGEGGQIPPEGSICFAEYDENGEPLACQFLQVGVFAEGMWARDGGAHLRTLWNLLIEYVRPKQEGLEVSLLTMTDADDSGERIAAAVKRMGFSKTGWSVFRRNLTCQ